MNSYITKDRLFSLLTAIFVSTVLFFSPWDWLVTGTVWALWAGMGVLTVVFGKGLLLLFEGSNRTVAYVANVYYNSQYLKKQNLLGEILDQVPPGVTVGSLLWHSYTLAGTLGVLLFILSNFIVELSVRMFQSLDDEDQKALLETIANENA